MEFARRFRMPVETVDCEDSIKPAEEHTFSKATANLQQSNRQTFLSANRKLLKECNIQLL